MEESCVFVSWQMGECNGEVKALKRALQARSVRAIVIRELPVSASANTLWIRLSSLTYLLMLQGDLLDAVINEADLFVIMGTKSYGKKTSGVIDTYQEMTEIKSSGKPFFLINMLPEESLMRFDEAATNLLLELQ